MISWPGSWTTPIEGLIFHCTPLCNKGLAAVDYARQWIARHGNEGR